MLERKWLRFLLVHGAEYGFDENKYGTVREKQMDLGFAGEKA